MFLAEVQSPSSVYADLNTTPPLYFRLASLEIYIVASQDSPYLWVWQRSRDAARMFPEKPDEIDDPAKSIEIAHFGITIPLAEIYRGIFAAPDAA